MEQWFDELKNGSHRDQLSFNYVAWKNEDIKIFYLDKTICKSQWFNWGGKHNMSEMKSSRKIEVSPQKKIILQLRNEFKTIIEKRNKIPTYKVNMY